MNKIELQSRESGWKIDRKESNEVPGRREEVQEGRKRNELGWIVLDIFLQHFFQKLFHDMNVTLSFPQLFFLFPFFTEFILHAVFRLYFPFFSSSLHSFPSLFPLTFCGQLLRSRRAQCVSSIPHSFLPLLVEVQLFLSVQNCSPSLFAPSWTGWLASWIWTYLKSEERIPSYLGRLSYLTNS